MWVFTAADPSLTFGGFEGETKEEMYNQLPEGSYPKTLYIEPGVNINELKNTISLHGFTYPFVVKPDIGMMGLMFRMVYNESQLKQYHAKMPVKYLIQKWVAYRHEYAVFYYRMPNSNQGTISGFLSKSAPQIV